MHDRAGACRTAFLASLACAVLPLAHLQAQSTAALKGRIVGTDGAGVAAAEVRVLDRRAFADTNGFFVLAQIPAGEHEVTVRRLGYADLSRRVIFAPADTHEARFELAGVVRLEPVEATAPRPTLPEFEEHRARGVGHFITREELARNPGKRMGDVLRRVPGLRVGTDRDRPGEAYALSGRGAMTMLAANPKCFVHVYVDGAPVFTGGFQPAYNLNALLAQEVEAVEYYQGGGSIPAKYNRTGSACGVMVIWLRR